MGNSDGKFVLLNNFQVPTIRPENIAVHKRGKNLCLYGVFVLEVGKKTTKRKIKYFYYINGLKKIKGEL